MVTRSSRYLQKQGDENIGEGLENDYGGGIRPRRSFFSTKDSK